VSTPQLDATLIDLGGVLTVDPWEALLLTPTVGVAARVGVDPVRASAAGASLWEEHCRSASAEQSYWRELSEILGADIPQQIVDEAEGSLLVATPDAQRILAILRGGDRPWGLITNNTAFWYPKQLALLGIAPGEPSWEFTSFSSGVTKSDAGDGLFEVAARSVGPSGVLVVDDRSENVERAQRCGFRATMYRPGEPIPFGIEGESDVETR
jgi:beta-phosphoglucomutase-like phosphatase (HAD superfamily)